MTPRFLLDTDTFIHIRQHRTRAIVERFRRLDPGESAISIIVYGELRYGAEKSQKRSQTLATLDQLIQIVPVLPLPSQAAEAYGVIRHRLASSGELIGSNDLWIAAHALAADLILVTNNVNEFQRVQGLRVENWVR